MKTEKYIVRINSNLATIQKNTLYEHNNPPLCWYDKFQDVLENSFKYMISNNSTITLNIYKKYNILDNNTYKYVNKEIEVLELKLYHENNIIYLSNIFKYDIETKKLTLKHSSLHWESIIKLILPKKLKLKKYSLKGVSFLNTKCLNSDDKEYFKSKVLDVNEKMSKYINYSKIDYFKVRFEETRKRRNKKRKESSGFYSSQKSVITLDYTFKIFSEKIYYHDFGHHIDYSLKRKYGYSFMKCIYKQINNKLKNMFILQYIKNGGILYEEKINYLLEPGKIFARLFAEYLSNRIHHNEERYPRYSLEDISSGYEAECYRFTIEELEEVSPIIDKLLLYL